jgi:hypothetical protein
MPMHFNKIKISLMFFVFLGLIYYGLSSMPTKAVHGYDYLVNHNNNYNVYTSPDTTPGKESALQNIDCVVNFMQSYVLASSSVPSSYACNKDTTPTTDDPNWHQSNQGRHPSSMDNKQQDIQQDSGIDTVKVIDLNGLNNMDEHPASYPYPSHFTPAVTYKINMQSERDNDSDEKKVYNENTVTKEERKLLLKACFERAEDKGNYISSKEMKECAKNYNS